jgi:hypothetical protein
MFTLRNKRESGSSFRESSDVFDASRVTLQIDFIDFATRRDVGPLTNSCAATMNSSIPGHLTVAGDFAVE